MDQYVQIDPEILGLLGINWPNGGKGFDRFRLGVLVSNKLHRGLNKICAKISAKTLSNVNMFKLWNLKSAKLCVENIKNLYFDNKD